MSTHLHAAEGIVAFAVLGEGDACVSKIRLLP